MNLLEVLRDRRLVLIAAGFAVLGVAFLGSLIGTADVARTAIHTIDTMRRFGPLGWIGFVLLQAMVAMVGFLPASLLGLAAGAIYGVALGFSLATAGVMLGALGTFGLARSMLRGAIVRLIARRAGFRRIDSALAADGFRLVLLMRISPIMPFSLTSFALGLSGVELRAYLSGTVASLPALLLYVVLGSLGAHSFAAIHHGSRDLTLALIGLGILATGLLTARIGHLIARALRVDPHSVNDATTNIGFSRD
ncbi:TVP38/TMEM64 family protein [Acidiphilium acidophilum]|uniref:TVP38/TMEM64 family membrane protein n=1 Tax=Acidiphilium acidophilum TaxID=76588 RepID=A0AAW9DKV9_ACIAO|nr:VTT domain-containing protein [Acidiphilium acidophilum]MDX5929621.1 VTT domain-containing protein [Acidiphilium acidophilum]GBR74255.1 hypothetical protein AA700_0246 [Acidiphilium acidophilum DSM 700]